MVPFGAVTEFAEVDERERFGGLAFQGGEGVFVAAAEGGDGGDVADQESADEVVFAGEGHGFVGFQQGGVAITEAGFNRGKRGGDVTVVAELGAQGGKLFVAFTEGLLGAGFVAGAALGPGELGIEPAHPAVELEIGGTELPSGWQ